MENKLSENAETIEYYKLVKSQCILGKLPKVESDSQFISKLDKMSDDLKIPLVSAFVMLNNAYKSELSLNRAKTIKQNIHSRDGSVAAKRPRVELSASPKLNKLDFISSHFSKCTSKAIKIAVALFLRPSYSEPLKRDFIFSILNDDSSEQKVSDIIELCQDNIGKSREYIKDINNLNTTEKQRKQLICALIELSEILRDRSCAKLAMCISLNGYISLIRQYLEHDHLKLITPFEPLINLYVKESIAKFTQNEERTKIQNQFKVNPKTTIQDVINGLPPVPSKVTNLSTKACVFKPDQIYQYYKGAVNYTRDITTTYHNENGRRYRIQTYNDCLYDVLGCAIEYMDTSSPNQQSPRAFEYELYDKMSWIERLNLIRFRTKILIEEAKGSELNEYQGASTDMTISWFDDNDISVSKTISIKKSTQREN
ncbi:putative gp83-like protein [Esparto virus]|uniref:Putative gp83-like protein n=1 Tax=Esparto virus TaxID=2072209 RepID=A0A2I7G2V2_9VIRU|nr:putative gp83-like protein [Esparto virus]AUQ43970.1 putative gp83-like protein [Esparto virus]